MPRKVKAGWSRLTRITNVATLRSYKGSWLYDSTKNVLVPKWEWQHTRFWSKLDCAKIYRIPLPSITIRYVIVKSSPKNLSANCRPSVGRLSAICWPTGVALKTDYQSADRFFGELFFTITKGNLIPTNNICKMLQRSLMNFTKLEGPCMTLKDLC